MKKGIILLAVSAPLAMGAEMPTVYGKINKVITYTSQDKAHDASRKSMDGVTEVQNSESRLGVKGKADIAGMDASYKIEIGLDSTDSGSNGAGIRIRQAYIGMKSHFGKLTFGQTYPVVTKMQRKVDPLTSTVAGHQGSDVQRRIENGVKSVGFNDRSRRDLAAYKTPSFGGLTYSVSTDRNEGSSNATNSGDEYWEHLVRFQRDLGSVDLDLYVGQVNWANAATNDNKYMMYGTTLGFGSVSFSVAMSNAESKAATKTETERMFGALTYKKNKNKVAFTYQTREDKDANKVTDEYTQMAISYARHYSKNVDLNVTVLQFEAKDKANTAKANQNDAKLLALGVQLKF